MLFHPSSLLFTFCIILSILLTISANSWFMVWVGLELNMLSFLPLILKKTQYSSESSLKYFMVQALASNMIILPAILLNYNSSMFSIIMLMALLTKTGAAPFHQWMPAMMEGLPWPLIFLLLSVQKMNPLIMLLSLNNLMWNNTVLLSVIAISALVGAIGGLLQTSLRKIMAYSSIAHLAWILSSLNMTSWTWSFYFVTYTLILMTITSSFFALQVFSLSQLSNKNKDHSNFYLSLSLLSLAGLPPFSGFIPKLLVSQELINSSNLFIMLFLLSSTFVSLFFYIRMILVNLLLKSKINTSWKPVTMKSYFMNILHLTGLMALPLIMIIVLSFMLFKLSAFKALKDSNQA